MSERTTTELRAYLRKGAPVPDEEFDSFLEQVGLIFKMRLEAELLFKDSPHLAKSRQRHLPLSWDIIKYILHPDTKVPPETLITQITRESLNETEAILHNMRKVLTREREKVSLGMVQQVDSHCLRWLSKQPGHNAIEKAGARQRILAIVRRENFNTLENRVFKDFLTRVRHETTLYLRKNEKEFKKHEIIKRVKRLGRLCSAGLRDPIMEGITTIRELPIPNYVLRQERRYSKIWKSYCELVRQANIAERLWLRRNELAETLSRLKIEVKKHTDPQAKHHCPIWFNYLDGKHKLLDKPFFFNVLRKYSTQEFSPTSQKQTIIPDLFAEDVIIDLTGQEPSRNLLIYGCHENAKPYLQDYSKPSIEDSDGNNHFFLRDLLVNPDPNNQDLHTKLRDYFEQLHALIGGKRWVVLVPDNWAPLWLETIIKSIPLARNNIFLLWRSVAAIIGSIEKFDNPSENDTVAVIDIQQSGVVNISKLTLAQGENVQTLIPQRKSFIRHKACYAKLKLAVHQKISREEAFLCGRSNSYKMTEVDIARINNTLSDINHFVLIDSIGVEAPMIQHLKEDGSLLESGAKRFLALRNKGEIAYFDELEALSLVVQTEDEQILAKPLVKANERSPGGVEIIAETMERAAFLKRESDYVDLVLCMGEATADAKLKIKRHMFSRSLGEDHAINLSAKVTPGQGMAMVMVMSDFLREPIELDFLLGMTAKNDQGQPITMSSLEDEMERSFPPDSPNVVADDSLWASSRYEIQAYMQNRLPPNGDWLARAQNIYAQGVSLPQGSSPLERLRRKNVFGNAPGQQYPVEFDYKSFFQKLAQDYQSSTHRKQSIRLIAWTYGSREPAFDLIRKKTVECVNAYAQKITTRAPLYQELTLCANLCISPNELRTCLRAVEYRIRDYSNSVSRDFYLLYNLLQFHPTILKDTGVFKNDGCWKLTRHIPHWYRKYCNSNIPISYVLKSILYLLRCRRFDGKRFLTKEFDLDHHEIIYNCLKIPVPRSQEDLRKLVIKYLNNKGTIDGLPVD